MLSNNGPTFRARLVIWLLLAVTVFAAIVFLSVNVARDLRLLNSASSDNVQWTLSQAEVEFLEYELHLVRALQESDPDLKTVRREFDIFYSRIKTLRESSLYEDLREVADFAVSLGLVQAFLDKAVPVIDSSDAELAAALPTLLRRSLGCALECAFDVKLGTELLRAGLGFAPDKCRGDFDPTGRRRNRSFAGAFASGALLNPTEQSERSATL